MNYSQNIMNNLLLLTSCAILMDGTLFLPLRGLNIMGKYSIGTIYNDIFQNRSVYKHVQESIEAQDR